MFRSCLPSCGKKEALPHLLPPPVLVLLLFLFASGVRSAAALGSDRVEILMRNCFIDAFFLCYWRIKSQVLYANCINVKVLPSEFHLSLPDFLGRLVVGVTIVGKGVCMIYNCFRWLVICFVVLRSICSRTPEKSSDLFAFSYNYEV